MEIRNIIGGFPLMESCATGWIRSRPGCANPELVDKFMARFQERRRNRNEQGRPSPSKRGRRVIVEADDMDQ
jgi:hypothetical protein